jgi:proteasome assembly chaperone (PAC2) family protein
MIAAFAGWNDASEAATFAARFLVDQRGARKMADIDPEEFYVFTETRPQVRVPGRFQRYIQWPANEFFYHVNQQGERDFVVLVGVEPQLKWRTFTEGVIGFCRQHGISMVVTLGALVADIPHTGPVRLSGTASPSWLARRLRALGVTPTRYAGPTGILGVLSAAAARRRLAVASLWGSTPEYLSASPNPKVALAMLETLSALVDLHVNLADLRELEAQFDREVDEVLASNPELEAYVRQLEEEEAQEEAPSEEERPRGEQEPLPSGEDLIRELEEYLRRRRSQRGRET